MEIQKILNNQNNLKTEEQMNQKARVIKLLDIKATVIKTLWYWP